MQNPRQSQKEYIHGSRKKDRLIAFNNNNMAGEDVNLIAWRWLLKKLQPRGMLALLNELV